MALSGTGNVTMSDGTLTLGIGGGATTFAGVIASGPGKLIKTGSGSLTLSNTTPLYYRNVFDVQSGTLTMAGGFESGSPPAGGVDVQAGATLALTNAPIAPTSPLVRCQTLERSIFSAGTTPIPVPAMARLRARSTSVEAA